MDRSYRPYLDGLRALAVGAVVVYHLDADWLPGGYLGVDVFFVLSGFLITGLLVGEHVRTGRIDLPAFWTRRVRRLLPALAVLLAVVIVTMRIAGDQLALASARGDFLSTLFYVANWHFILSGQSYFEQYVAVSPLRHTWSLGIEEQFYLLWPLLTWLVLGRWGRRSLGFLAVVGAVVSFVLMALLFDPADPSRAYYGTDTRIGELLVGAVLAVALAGPARERILRLARPLTVPALAVVLVAIGLLADSSPAYYGAGAAVFALAVATAIAGFEAGSPASRIFAIRPAVALGVISYGVYLWHFPIVRLLVGVFGTTGAPVPATLVILATLAIAAASFVLVERPIRRGLPPFSDLRPRTVVRLVPMVSGALVLAILGLTPASPPPAFADPGLLLPSAGPVSAASEAPAISGRPGPASGSTTPSTRPIVVGVIGDSVMVSALPGFTSAAAARGWQLASGAVPACPVGGSPLYDATGKPSPYNPSCVVVADREAAVAAARPTVLIWHDLQSVLARRSADGRLLLPGTAAWTDDLVATWRAVLDRFTANGTRVVILLPPLRSLSPAGCAGAPDPARCRTIQDQDRTIREATRVFADRVGPRPDVEFVSVDDLLCPRGYPCPASIDGIGIRLGAQDQTHFTTEGATWFATRLLDRVAPFALGGPPATGTFGVAR